MLIVREPLTSPGNILYVFYKAAILLNANVALLAIPNVDQPSTLAPNRVRIFSYISVATSLGSIGFGFGAQLAGLNNLHPPSTSPVRIFHQVRAKQL